VYTSTALLVHATNAHKYWLALTALTDAAENPT
jgi:hypothetical protein